MVQVLQALLTPPMQNKANDANELNDVYLGDGVYASCDGHHIWLAANHHANKVIALEPAILDNLMRYAQSLGMAPAAE